MRSFVGSLAVGIFLALLPTTAAAQAVIAGTVRDTSGAILPGVTVEASSPALIEKVRTAVSDGTGQYRIEDLRPGTYTVNVHTAGFSTFEREGVELTGSFTATINAEMKVGALEETVTVTGESPIVDVQSARRQTVLNNDVLKAIPTVRSYNALVVVVPGVVTNTNDVATGTATTQFPIHGGRNNEGRMTIDGLNVGNPPGGNQPPGYSVDVGNSEEISFTTSGGLGESETAGLVMNIVPKTGGNSIHGAAVLQRQRQAPAVRQLGRDRASPRPTPLTKIYDVNAAVRRADQEGSRLVLRHRAHAGQHARQREPVRQPERRRSHEVALRTGSGQARILRSDVGEHQRAPDLAGDASATRSARSGTSSGCAGSARAIRSASRLLPWCRPRRTARTRRCRLRVPQVTWTSPLTNRLLLDAGFGGTYYGWGNFERDPESDARSDQGHRTVRGRLRSPTAIVRASSIARRTRATTAPGRTPGRRSASYVTGAHSMKVGYQGTLMTDDRTWTTNSTDLWYRFNNGVPNQLTQTISPWINNARAGWDAVFAQEQWTMGRLTLQGAVRFDVAKSWFPEQNIGPDRFLPMAYHFPETKGIDSYKDITPRLGVAYDVFGNGKTAVKMNLRPVSRRRRRAAQLRQHESDDCAFRRTPVRSACRA